MYTLYCIGIIILFIISVGFTFQGSNSFKGFVKMWIGIICLVFFVSSVFHLDNKLNTPIEFESKLNLSDTLISKNNTLDVKKVYHIIKVLQIPHPKIVYCQILLESGNFTSNLYKTNNNLLGMKKSNSRPTVRKEVKNNYASYHTWELSVLDFALWADDFKIKNLSEEEYLKLLSRKYSTDIHYSIKILEMKNSINWEQLE